MVIITIKCLLCCLIRGIKVWFLQKINNIVIVTTMLKATKKNLIVLMIICIIDDKKNHALFLREREMVI